MLEAAGAVAAAASLHDDGKARDAAWRSSVRQLARGRSLDADVRRVLGRGRRLLLAWSGFYLKALAVPALLGFAIWPAALPIY